MMNRLALTIALLLAAGAALADPMTVIIDRERDGISLYVATPATDWPALTGTDLAPLLEADGTIDVNRLYDGTFDQADKVFGPINMRVNGETADYDGLSLMVHDPDVLPAFLTPYHAELAISVCTSPETVEHLGLETLMSYAGYYMWKVDPASDLTLEFPRTGRDVIEVQILDYHFGRLTDQRIVSLEDGAALSIAHKVAGQNNWLLISALAGMCAIGGLAAALILRRRPTSAAS